ncbi:MAG: hypothetical protein ACE5NA_12810 [Nitrospiraceae bacterium]
MANRFKDKGMRQMYDSCIDCARDINSEFYVNGKRRSGASHRNSFWAGVDGIRPHWIQTGTLGYAAWRAGQDFGKENSPKEGEKE